MTEFSVKSDPELWCICIGSHIGPDLIVYMYGFQRIHLQFVLVCAYNKLIKKIHYCF